ncbi:MAG TPA: SAM-dependent methyltransferase [Pseudonocardiaceae bacterium]
MGVAAIRARESRRADRLFVDPYAQAFLDAAPSVLPAEPGDLAALGPLGAMFSYLGVIRTRFFDDYLLAAVAGDCRQVVLLAAGLDTRAFRLAWPDGVRLFEVDFPAVLSFKDQALARQATVPVPRCTRKIVAADLRANWQADLVEAGFEHTVPTAWLAEGLLIYLSAGDAARLLTSVGELSTAGSRLAFEHVTIADTTVVLTQARTMPAMDEWTALWKGGLGQDAPEWLASRGWTTHTHDSATLGTSYGRAAPAQLSGGFLTALRTR